MAEVAKYTETLLRRTGHVLLGRKTRKFAVGLHLLPGGKIKEKEDAAEATLRELSGETGVTSQWWNVVPVALINSYLIDEQGNEKLAKLFVSEIWTFSGEPRDNPDELVGQEWFSNRNLPFESMLPGDRHWLPRILNGERLVGTITYQTDFSTLRDTPSFAPISQADLNRLWYAP